ncbi:MAG: DUF3572 domain-containing protein [Sphingomonadaceae bacterium]|nr:DUF3572 domain-containing protein [Sphingomonadaceae bacterium]
MVGTRDNRKEAETLALRALTFVVGNDRLRPRLLDLTGLDAATLRGRVGDPQLLAATLAFLEQHEPDLMACAAALEVAPRDISEARLTIEGASAE